MNTLPDDKKQKWYDFLSGKGEVAAEIACYITDSMEEYAKAYAPVSENDMTAEEFYNSGLFNLDFMTAEEKQTIYTATELYAKGKLRQAAPVPGKEEVYREALDKINKHACKLEDEIWTTDNRTINKRITEIIFQSSQALVSTKQSNESSFNKDAVEFAEWCDENYFGIDRGLWATSIGEIDEKVYTTQELYNLFKQKQ